MHGESVAPSLAEDLEEQKRVEARVSKCEADRAELIERLMDLEQVWVKPGMTSKVVYSPNFLSYHELLWRAMFPGMRDKARYGAAAQTSHLHAAGIRAGAEISTQQTVAEGIV